MLTTSQLHDSDCTHGPKRVHALLATAYKRKHGTLDRAVRTLLPALLCFAAFDGMGQSARDTVEFARTTVFASGLGNGLYYSIGIDHRWRSARESWMSLSVGATYVPDNRGTLNVPKYSLPIQWNWFRGQSHHREHGAGLTFGSGWYAGSGSGDGPLASNGIYLFAKPIGYRFQRPHGGFFLRVNILAWARIIELNRRYVEEHGYWETPPIFPWVGFDLGYTFRHHQDLNRS